MTTCNVLARAMKATMISFGTSSRLAALLALSIGTLGNVSANADQVIGDSRTRQVKLIDLDLSTAEGQQIAQARLNAAARSLCNRVADELDLSHQANYIKCIDSSVAKADQLLQALINQQSATRVARADVK
jgi:UrcA family protein